MSEVLIEHIARVDGCIVEEGIMIPVGCGQKYRDEIRHEIASKKGIPVHYIRLSSMMKYRNYEINETNQ